MWTPPRQILEQSGFEYSDSPFDVAMYGNMYFNVSYGKENGRVFQTRNGQWGLDNEGYLWLDGAGRVQGENGDIYIGSDAFTIDERGVIRNENQEIIDTLLLTYIPPMRMYIKRATVFSLRGRSS